MLTAYPKNKWEQELRASSTRITRTGDFTNDRNLKIRWYSWEVPAPRAVVVFAHGLGVYGSFEMLTSMPLGTARAHYDGSWPQKMNDANLSLYCLDHQGHGRSDSARSGKRCYFNRIDDLVRDYAKFVELIKSEYRAKGGAEVHVFMVGTSLGGFVATRAALDYPRIADGLVALAPMLSLDRLSKKGINRVLLPLLSLISMLFPTLPIAKTESNALFPLTQREVEQDALTWPSGKKRTRARVAAESYLGTLKLKKPGVLEKITMPVLTFHGVNDPMTDPSGSQMLVDRASSASRTLRWVENVFHDLCHEKPGSDIICNEIIQWCLTRLDDSSRSAKRAKTTGKLSNGASKSTGDANKAAKTKAIPKHAKNHSPSRRKGPSF